MLPGISTSEVRKKNEKHRVVHVRPILSCCTCFKMFQQNSDKQESTTQFCPVSIWSTVVDGEDVLDVEVDDVLDEVVEEEDTVDEVLQGTLKANKINKRL